MNRRFTDELLALMFRSRTKRMDRAKQDSPTQRGEVVPLRIPFKAFVGMRSLNFPNGVPVKRIKVN